MVLRFANGPDSLANRAGAGLSRDTDTRRSARFTRTSGRYPAWMSQLDEHDRPEPHPATGKLETLVDFLDFQRATLAWKCSGMDADSLRTKLVASPVTLDGLLKHMAWVEYLWFPWTCAQHGQPGKQHGPTPQPMCCDGATGGCPEIFCRAWREGCLVAPE